MTTLLLNRTGMIVSRVQVGGVFMRRLSSSVKEPLVLTSTENRVRTITMNDPTKLNGWTQNMLLSIQKEFNEAANDSSVDVVILTGKGKYYCAGVNLSAVLRPMHPQTLHDMIVKHNQEVFESFLDFPKPLIAALNGPAIGASVTTATLCDAMIMAEDATILTPFARLGVPPEGCSSVHFARTMGKASGTDGEALAQRMLGPEAWAPNGTEAVEIGLAHRVTPLSEVQSTAQALAEDWIEKGRLHRAISMPNSTPTTEKSKQAAEDQILEYKAVNAAESIALGRAFLGPTFLQGQINFLTSKGKTQPALAFKALLALRPLWSKLLTKESDAVRFSK
mmetsp:Transcript_5464/g.7100  ORF Transcript_5464/g.7100 Transcript_5464/m.7100 type:complete len:336 (-) Transcript_5464:74-1081(-)